MTGLGGAPELRFAKNWSRLIFPFVCFKFVIRFENNILIFRPQKLENKLLFQFKTTVPTECFILITHIPTSTFKINSIGTGKNSMGCRQNNLHNNICNL